jgi:hypothetical protein
MQEALHVLGIIQHRLFVLGVLPTPDVGDLLAAHAVIISRPPEIGLMCAV